MKSYASSCTTLLPLYLGRSVATFALAPQRRVRAGDASPLVDVRNAMLLLHPHRPAAADPIATAVVLVAVLVGDRDGPGIVTALRLVGRLRAVLHLRAGAVVAARHAGRALVLVALRQDRGR